MGRDITLADICIVACADAFRGDGEIMASAMGTIPSIAARLALRCFEPDLLISDGEAYFVRNPGPVGVSQTDAIDFQPVVEGWIPYRKVFDMLWWGRRHVMMGASQIDKYGNQNISAIGPWEKPKAQLLGVRGAPGNTINHKTSYWVPNHSTKSFVSRVDIVCGVGYDRASQAGPSAQKYHKLERVVSNKAVFDFQSPDRSMRLVSLHPGVTSDEVATLTGFEFICAEPLSYSRVPTEIELQAIDRYDPKGLRFTEVDDRQAIG